MIFVGYFSFLFDLLLDIDIFLLFCSRKPPQPLTLPFAEATSSGVVDVVFGVCGMLFAPGGVIDVTVPVGVLAYVPIPIISMRFYYVPSTVLFRPSGLRSRYRRSIVLRFNYWSLSVCFLDEPPFSPPSLFLISKLLLNDYRLLPTFYRSSGTLLFFFLFGVLNASTLCSVLSGRAISAFIIF